MLKMKTYVGDMGTWGGGVRGCSRLRLGSSRSWAA